MLMQEVIQKILLALKYISKLCRACFVRNTSLDKTNQMTFAHTEALSAKSDQSLVIGYWIGKNGLTRRMPMLD